MSEQKPLAPFGVRLREAIGRSDAVASRAELLRKTGLENKTLRRYEIGERSPPLDLVHRLARVLQVSTADLVGPPPQEFVGQDDAPAWVDFVRRGYPQLFLARGATVEMIEACRTGTRFKGTPSWKDYVIAMEDRMDELEGETPQAVRDAREANLHLERDLSAFVKPPATTKKDR